MADEPELRRMRIKLHAGLDQLFDWNANSQLTSRLQQAVNQTKENNSA